MSETRENQLNHHRLEVYQLALTLAIDIDRAISAIPPARRYLTDQIRRAALSIPLNIAEGAGEFAGPEKNRFYRIARRSTTECSAGLEMAQGLGLLKRSELDRLMPMFVRVASMLTALVRRNEAGAA